MTIKTKTNTDIFLFIDLSTILKHTFELYKTEVQISQPVIGPFGSSGGCHVSLTVVGSDCSMSAVNSAGLDDGAVIIILLAHNWTKHVLAHSHKTHITQNLHSHRFTHRHRHTPHHTTLHNTKHTDHFYNLKPTHTKTE